MLSWIWKRRRPQSASRRTRLGLERLETRAVPAGLRPSSFGDRPDGPAVATVFVESNNPEPGGNAVLAFSRSADGTLTQIGTFSTHGTGQLNLPKVIGPDDSSQEVVATPDGRFLFAVNQGSNTVAAFRIRRDGGLDFIDTFDSGGVQPDSIGIAGGKLYVSNRGDATATNPDGTVAPNITGFTIRPNGTLTPIPDSTVTLPVGTSPSQNLISRDGRFLFSDIFGVGTAPQSNTFAPFRIARNGTLDLAPGGNVAAQAPGSTDAPTALLGAAVHPSRNIVYAGLTALNEVGVFTYDNTGQLTFVGATPPNDQGGIAACWVDVSPDGKFLYTGDTGSNSVGVYSLADPLHPVLLQEFFVGGPQAPAGEPAGARETAVFQVAVDPAGRFVYAVGQDTSPDGTFQEGNQLHILSVGRDGTLSEPHGPVILPPGAVPGTAHPQGIAVVAGVGREQGDRDNGTRGADAFFAGHAASARGSGARVDADVVRALLQQRHEGKENR